MKQILSHALLVIALALVVVGCQREIFESDTAKPNGKIEVLPDGRLKIPLFLTSPNKAVIETRSGTEPNLDAENLMTSVWVFVWEGTADPNATVDDNAKLLQMERGVVYTAPGGTSSAFVVLQPYDKPCYMRVYVNLDDDTQMEIATYEPGETLFSQHKNLTISLKGFYEKYGAGEAGGDYTNLSSPYPMSSEPKWLAEISPKNDADTDLAFDLNSTGARIDVMTYLPDFTIQEVTLLNGASNGYLRRRDDIPTNLGGTIQYAAVPAHIVSVPPHKTEYPEAHIYLFANNGTVEANRTHIIIKGQKTGFPEGYYKVQIRYLKEGKNEPDYSYDIARNTLYAVNIIEANGPGFATFDEAVANSPHNIVTDITVTDGTSTDIFASNGRYYLGLTNSEFYVYSAGMQTGLVASTLTWGGGGASYTGPTPAFSITTTGSISVNLNSLPVYNTPTDLTISFPADDGRVDGYVGDITIRIGDLMKTVKVYQRNYIRQTGVPLYDFETDEAFVMGDVSGIDWIGLSGTDRSEVKWGGVVDNTSGGIVLHFKSNTDSRRQANFYLSTNNARGRAKIYADQNVPNESFAYSIHASDALFWIVDTKLLAEFDDTQMPMTAAGRGYTLTQWRTNQQIFASSNVNINTEYSEGRYAAHAGNNANNTAIQWCRGLHPAGTIDAKDIATIRYYLPAQAELQMIHAYHTDRKDGWVDANYWSSTQGTTNANANAINFLQEGAATNNLANNSNAYVRCLASPHGLRDGKTPDGMGTWDGRYYPYLAPTSPLPGRLAATKTSAYPLIVNYEIWNGYERGMRSFSLTQERRTYELRSDSHEDEENYPQFRIAVADAPGGMMSWHTAMGYTTAVNMINGKAFFEIASSATGCNAYSEPGAPAGSWRLPTTAELQSIWTKGGSNFQTAGGPLPRQPYPTKNKNPNSITTANSQTTHINPANENIHFVNASGDLINTNRLPSLYNAYSNFTPMSGENYWAASTYKEGANPYTMVYQHNFANGLGQLTAIAGGTGYVRCVKDVNP